MSLSARLNNEFTRFLLVGGFNTVVGQIIYILALFIMPYRWAYTVMYIFGVSSSYYLNSRFAFRSKLSLRKAIQYPLVYAVQYMLGIVLITFWIGVVGIPEVLGPPFVIVFTIPVTFVLSRLIIKREVRPISTRETPPEDPLFNTLNTEDHRVS